MPSFNVTCILCPAVDFASNASGEVSVLDGDSGSGIFEELDTVEGRAGLELFGEGAASELAPFTAFDGPQDGVVLLLLYT